jgi:hypothetical protein
MMTTLETERLLLRPFTMRDRDDLHHILSDPQVTATLLDVPEPFTLSDAADWIRYAQDGAATGSLYAYAMVAKHDAALLGWIDLEIEREHRRGDMAYWLGQPYWGRGFASEAARCMVRFGFETLDLNRIYAQCIASNSASARVMQKAGMRYEATRRHGTRKGEQFYDLHVYGMTRADYDEEHRP